MTFGAFVVLTLLLGCSDERDTRQMTASSASDLRVAVENDLVSVRAREARVVDVLEEIARQAPLEFSSDEAPTERITLELRRVPLATAIRRILRDRNFLLSNGEREQGEDSRELRVLAYHEPSSTAPTEALALDVRHGDPETRRAAVEDLGTVDDADGATEIVTSALADTNLEVRREAVASLANIGTNDAVAGLAIALQDQSEDVREDAVDALADLREPATIPLLEEALRDPDEDVRQAAIEALAEMRGDEAAHALAIALDDRDPALREDAVDALGENGGPQAIALLQRALGDAETQVRGAAAEWLAELTGPESEP